MSEAANGAPERGAESPARIDPWSGGSGGKAGFFAVSTLIHAALLVALATLSITVVREVRKVDVEIVERQPGLDDLEGAPSLDDFAGLLDVARAPRREAARTRGPRVRNLRAAEMPKIGGIGPALGRAKTGAAASANLSFGSGSIGGLGGSFGDYVGGLRKVGLDVALVVDTTESMQFVIDQVKERAAALVRSLQEMVPTTRIGIVAYRDEGDEYVTRWTDLSFRTDKLLDFVSQISAAGGGDYEEAVLEAIDAAIEDLSWRTKSKKIVILIGGSPPHPEDVDDLEAVVRAFREAGGHLSAIDVTDGLHLRFSKWMWQSLHGNKPFEPSPKPEHFQEVTKVYRELAAAGGGELVRLEDGKQLIRDVLVLTFGQRWKVEMAKYVKDLS
jgi:Mg-chelatase subunit ChlD